MGLDAPDGYMFRYDADCVRRRPPTYPPTYPPLSRGEFDLVTGGIEPEPSSSAHDRVYRELDGTFQPQHAVKIGPKTTNGETGIAVGDFNSDGLLDLEFESIEAVHARGCRLSA